MHEPSPPSLPQASRPTGRLRLVTACVVVAIAAMLGTSAAAQAAKAPDPACPTSLRAVPGGAQDAEAGGRDDGEAGPGADYEAGQVLVQLTPDAPRAAFECVLRELDAGLIDGGAGKAGLGRLPGLMLVQLAPGKSVAKTVRLLNSRAYADIIELAQSNDHLESLEPPNDPLWNRQWGFDQGSLVPNAALDAQGHSVEQSADQVQQDATRTGPLESMRLPQAWDMTAQRKARWFRRAVQVAFIDDSLFEHEDLVQNTSTTKSRIQVPVGFNAQSIEMQPGASGRFYLNTGPAGSVSCAVPVDADPRVIASLVGRRIPALCDRTGDDVHTVVLTIDGDHGTVVLNDGRNGAVSIDVGALAEVPEGLEDEEDGRVLFVYQLLKQFRAQESLFKTLSVNNQLKVALLRADDDCFSTDTRTCLRYAIVYESPDLQPTIDRTRTRVTQETIINGRPIYPPGRALLHAAGATVAARGTVAKGRTISVRWKGPDLTGLVTEWKDDSSPIRLADVVKKVTAGGDYRQQVNQDAPQWPGGAPDHSNHGQAVAGLLAATANNAIGIAGVPGPNIKLKVTGIATPLTTSAILTAIDYATGTVGAKVVNMSIGNSYDDDETPPDVIDSTKADPREEDLVQQAMARRPKTLFVLAAGNEATDHRRPGLRHARQYNGKGASKGHCSPRGNYETEYWDIRDVPFNMKRYSTRGGALSELRMPDGTFDRGNILCVAAMAAAPVPPANSAPARRLAKFSSWGRDFVDVAAPGEKVLTTGPNNQYRVVDGTSFAAPIVAGVAATVLWLNPGMDASKVKCAIMSSATSAPLDPPDLSAMPFDNHYGGESPLTVNGMVVASEALSAAQALAGRRGKSRGTGQEPRATCVQRRESRIWNAETRRWETGGGWVNATRDELKELSSAPPAAPPPAPAQNERP